MNVKQVKTTYISRAGKHLDVNLAQPALKEWLNLIVLCSDHPMAPNPTLDGKIKAGIGIIRSQGYDAKAQAAEYKPKHITASRYSESAGILFYSTAQTESHATAGLGQLVMKNAMVCREKAMLTHLFLAELGIPTRYQAGSVKVGEDPVDGHAWVEWIEPATGRGETVEAVIDGTWGKVYTNYSFDKYVVAKRDPEVYFKPIEELDAAVIADALGIVGRR